MQPRLAKQFRQWEEQLGLWLTGEVGATPHGGAHGGPGRLESAVDDILQQVYDVGFTLLCCQLIACAVPASPATLFTAHLLYWTALALRIAPCPGARLARLSRTQLHARVYVCVTTLSTFHCMPRVNPLALSLAGLHVLVLSSPI